MRPLLAGLAALLLASCDEAGGSLTIGGKDFAESSILSEMMAALAEDAGIPVTRRLGLGDTLVNLEALKAGEIDLYAEYDGTGLVMLGQPPTSDGDQAIETVRALYEPLGLVWGERFGFENNYGLAMRAGRAEALGIETVSDLVGEAAALTIGLDENFAERPLDGFEALTARYGMEFGDVLVVPPDARIALYDRLLAGEIDVAEVFTTDGQLADLDLRLLEDDLAFFPVYEPAPLVRSDALVRFPELRGALARLDGALDAETMQRLNAGVERDALSPRDVARAALAELGLIEADEALEIERPVVVAHSPLLATEDEAGRALRAVRQAFPGRRVLLGEVADPLGAMAAGEAPLALVAAVEFVDLDGAGAPEPRPFEGVGVVGQTLLHLVSLGDARSLADVASLAVGPLGLGLATGGARARRRDRGGPGARDGGGRGSAAGHGRLGRRRRPGRGAARFVRRRGAPGGGRSPHPHRRLGARHQPRALPAAPPRPHPRRGLRGTGRGRGEPVLPARPRRPRGGGPRRAGSPGPGRLGPHRGRGPGRRDRARALGRPGRRHGPRPRGARGRRARPRPAGARRRHEPLPLDLGAHRGGDGALRLAHLPLRAAGAAMTGAPASHVLAPVDLVQESSWAKILPQAFTMAEAMGGRVTLMTVVPEILGGLDWRYAIRGETGGSEELDVDALLREANERLQALGREAAPSGTGFDTLARYGTVYEEILDVARELPASQIVMAARRPRVTDYLLGENTSRVVRHAPCSVLVVRD